ncbi:MAG TPA: CpaF family protein [Sphingomicrobium sp.]|nr:CpaF family protein [Sphingomicrobium sp.]
MWQVKKPGRRGTAPAAAAVAVDEAAASNDDQRLVTLGDAGAFTQRDAHTDLKVQLHQSLIDLINLSALDKMSRDQIEAEVGHIIHDELKKQNHALNQNERKQLVGDVLDELLGLGPLEPLLKDPTITDILVNGPARVFVERFGVLEPTPVRFKDEKHLLRIIQKIVSAVGRRVDESSPMVDARLADGSRVNAVVPPLALDGSLLSIRKFARVPISMDRLVEIGSIPLQIAEVLKAIVASRRDVLISGGTGSGKTTLLNAMSAYIDGRERIVTIEDSAELQLQQRHIVRLETRPANIEGKGEITQRDLVKNALRMRPDRIIVGEVRAGEAFDMLQAMNTGHEGSMTTVHANTPRDALSRVEQMIGMSGIDIPARSARSQIASAIHVVIQVSRLSDGRRKLTSVAEVTGMEGDVVTMQEIFRYRQTGIAADGQVNGKFEATGIRPRFIDQFVTHGINLPASLFRPDAQIEA